MDKKRAYELPAEEIAVIHAYLYDVLPSAEREQFERRLANEPAWRDKVEEVTLLVLGVQEANLADDLGKWRIDLVARNRTENIAQGKPAVPFYRHWWMVASVFLLATLTIWAIWRSDDTPQSLYLSFYEPDIGLPVEMSASDDSKYRFYDGMISYKEGNYTDALTKWENLATDETPSDTLGYYRAMAYMGLADIPAAASLLTDVVANSNSAFHTDAVWYLALCRLHQNDKGDAQLLLWQIPQDERARQLLAQLE